LHSKSIILKFFFYSKRLRSRLSQTFQTKEPNTRNYLSEEPKIFENSSVFCDDFRPVKPYSSVWIKFSQNWFGWGQWVTKSNSIWQENEFKKSNRFINKSLFSENLKTLCQKARATFQPATRGLHRNLRNACPNFVILFWKHNVPIYRCGNISCPRSSNQQCCDILGKDYKFYLAFENSNCLDYISEKFWDNALM